jgi:hypothetical protein
MHDRRGLLPDRVLRRRCLQRDPRRLHEGADVPAVVQRSDGLFRRRLPLRSRHVCDVDDAPDAALSV